MMEASNSIVIYTSKRGSTKQYAEWIAEELGCEAVSFSDVKKKDIDLHDYACIIYGGWIRGSGIVGFDKFVKKLDEELMKRLIVFGAGMADETAENYAQVWGYSIGKIDPKNEKRILLYILGGRYTPSKVTGLDSFLMKVMRLVLLSGRTDDAGERADFMKDRIDHGVDLVRKENVTSLIKDADKLLEMKTK